MTIGKGVTKRGGEELEQIFLTFSFCELRYLSDISKSIYFPIIKWNILIGNMEGIVSQICYLGPSFIVMKCRKIIMVEYVMSLHREKSGVLIDVLDVYVPPLVTEISPF